MKLMQLLPGTSAYRNPFTPNNPETGTRDDGHVWKVVGADYASQEAVVAGTFSNEIVFLTALKEGLDFHSYCTSFMFPEQWQALGGDPKPKGKPKDKLLLGLRQKSKVTSFGIMYGKSAIGLGESLGVPSSTSELIEEYELEYQNYMLEHDEDYKAFYVGYRSGRNTKGARHEWIKNQHKLGLFLPDIVTGDDLIDRFHNAFPEMAKFLDDSSEEGAVNKHIYTPDVINRVRRFPHPQFSGEESKIRRQAQNFKIQSSSANMTKYAICLLKNHIEANNLQNKMKFCLALHDEIQYIAREDFAEEALELIVSKMEEAGEFILSNTLQKAEGAITDVWEK
jgi:DNA polymerase I-like protein with 3'-5' exonuclease and polymerase domains